VGITESREPHPTLPNKISFLRTVLSHIHSATPKFPEGLTEEAYIISSLFTATPCYSEDPKP